MRSDGESTFLACRFWKDAPSAAAGAAARLGPTCWALKRAAATAFTEGDVGYYARPDTGAVALFGRGATAPDLRRCKEAAAEAVGAGLVRDAPLTAAEAGSGAWVKVAYSPFLRRAGELLNFFPGRYPGGLPNAPSPFAATLSGALLGAGLGYGAGVLGEKALPQSFNRGRLRRALAAMGALAGGLPGAAWSYSNLASGKSLLDGGALSPPPDSPPSLSEGVVPRLPPGLAEVALSPRYRKGMDALEKTASAGAFSPLVAPRPGPTPLDVRVDALGRTLWDAGAPAQLIGTTVGVLDAAARMPGGSGDPGRVTPHQLGELAFSAGAGYAAGRFVGAVLGTLTGLPRSVQNDLARTGAVVNIVGTALPALYGR